MLELTVGCVVVWLGLGTLHAMTMGFLGSVMVTRVSTGHSGRPLVADNVAWSAFLALQLAVVLRMLGWYGSTRAYGQAG